MNVSFDYWESSLSSVRSLKRWPGDNYKWDNISDFLNSNEIPSGIHSILLEGVILDIYIDIKVGTDALIYFHGNCPRPNHFKLPVFSGFSVTSEIHCTKIVPSDPILLLDRDIQLSWHIGNQRNNIQEVYKKVFRKVCDLSSSKKIIFWGGSAGGYAALYYSYFFEKSTAVVWNPQTIVKSYVKKYVNKYINVAFTDSNYDAIVSDFPKLCFDVTKLYSLGHNNNICYIQNDQDWHTQSHLAPFLNAMGAASRVNLPTNTYNIQNDKKPDIIFEYNGLLSDKFYLYVGRISEGHNPPDKNDIHALIKSLFIEGDISKTNYSLINNKYTSLSSGKQLDK
jgi:hypothetical protein